VRLSADLSLSIEGRDVIIVEDIVDSGSTFNYLRRNLATRHPGASRCAGCWTRWPGGRWTSPWTTWGSPSRTNSWSGYGWITTASTESPVRRRPRPGARHLTWVGVPPRLVRAEGM
jgi:hypoxanthine phosphoribosyltransferase